MKTKNRWLPAALLLAAAMAGLLGLRQSGAVNPFNSTFSYDYPVYATGDDSGNIYAIDTSLRRVSKVNSEGLLEYSIAGGLRDGSSFFYANQIAVSPGGKLFIVDELRDQEGFYVLRERILLVDGQGKFLGELYSIEHPEGHHDPTLVQRGRIISLEAVGESILDVAILMEDRLDVVRIEYSADKGGNIGEHKIAASYPFPDALLYVADVSLAPGGLTLASLRNGLILELDESGDHRPRFDAGEHRMRTGELVVPWEVDRAPNGRVYFVDL